MRHFAGLLAIIPLAALCGDGDIVFGPCAMDNAAGTDWNISVGAAAMYGSRVGSFNAAIGHRAGEFSALCVSNVFLGVRAGKSATNCANCVGIGVDSLRGAQGESGSTDVNGRFVSRNGEIRLSTGGGSPEIVYERGVLSVEGDLHVSGNLVFTNHEFTATDTYIGGYDLYVDAVRGDDEDDGTLLYPKKTLDAALSLVDRNGMRVCVRAGTYSYPEFFKKGMGYGSAPTVAYRVEMYGVDGADRTVIRNDSEDPAWIAGYTVGMETFKGFTFVGFSQPNLGTWRQDVFTFAYFEDCVFKDTSCSVTRPNGRNGDAIFGECIMNRCRVANCNFTATNADGYYYRSVFNGCKLYGCEVIFTSNDGSVIVATATQLEDTFINVPSSVYGALKRRWNTWTPPFSNGHVYNSTVCVSNSLNSLSTYYHNSIVGIGGADGGGFIDSFHTNSAPYVLSMLGDDLRPNAETVRTNPYLRFTGYGALQDIMTKNALVSFVASAVASGIPQGASEETRNALMSVSSNLTASASQPAHEPPVPYDGYASDREEPQEE